MTIVHFLPTKISSTHKKTAVSSSKWIVSELFHFSNHSKLIAFHILILFGRRWFRSWNYNTNYYSSFDSSCSDEVKVYLLFFPVVFFMEGPRINHRNSDFHIIVSHILLEAAVPICFTKELLFKVLQNLQKKTCAGVYF